MLTFRRHTPRPQPVDPVTRLRERAHTSTRTGEIPGKPRHLPAPRTLRPEEMSALYVAPFIILGVAVSASLLYVDGLLTLGQLVATLAVTLVLVTGAVAGWVHTRFRKTVPVGPGAYLVFGTCVGALNTLSSSQDPRDQEAARRLLARWDDMHSWAQEHTRWRCALAGLPRGASDVLARARARAVADQVLGQMVAVAAEAEALAQDAQRRRDQGAARERVAAIRSLLADRTAQA